MGKKKPSKDYSYYTMKIPNDLKLLFEKFIEKYSGLGFRNVSQFALHVLQQEARKILKENPDLEESFEKL